MNNISFLVLTKSPLMHTQSYLICNVLTFGHNCFSDNICGSSNVTVRECWSCRKKYIRLCLHHSTPPLWLYRAQTQKFAGGKISGLERKSFTRQNSLNTKVSGFKVPTSDSVFKISGDPTKLESSYFGFIHLCVSKPNPALQRSGLVTNLEQFPPV